MATDGGVTIEVRDHGPGIAPDVLPRLFEPFFTTKPEGLGVGLAISRSILEAAGGRIRAENAADGGARFLVWLPASRTAAAESEDDVALRAAGLRALSAATPGRSAPRARRACRAGGRVPAPS